MFSYKIVNRVSNNFLVDGSEIFVNFSMKTGVRKPQSFFLVEVGPSNNAATNAPLPSPLPRIG